MIVIDVCIQCLVEAWLYSVLVIELHSLILLNVFVFYLK